MKTTPMRDLCSRNIWKWSKSLKCSQRIPNDEMASDVRRIRPPRAANGSTIKGDDASPRSHPSRYGLAGTQRVTNDYKIPSSNCVGDINRQSNRFLVLGCFQTNGIANIC